MSAQPLTAAEARQALEQHFGLKAWVIEAYVRAVVAESLPAGGSEGNALDAGTGGPSEVHSPGQPPGVAPTVNPPVPVHPSQFRWGEQCQGENVGSGEVQVGAFEGYEGLGVYETARLKRWDRYEACWSWALVRAATLRPVTGPQVPPSGTGAGELHFCDYDTGPHICKGDQCDGHTVKEMDAYDAGRASRDAEVRAYEEFVEWHERYGPPGLEYKLAELRKALGEAQQ